MTRVISTFFVLIGSASCAPAPGVLEARVYGEAYIEEELPAADTSDGWTIRFDRFLVNLGEVEATSSDAEAGRLQAPAFRIFDLAQSSGGEGHLVSEAPFPAGAVQEVAFQIAPATAGVMAANASADDVARMVNRGAALLVDGVALRGTETKSFSWAFDTSTHYHRCASTASVTADGRGRVELTIHGDHLFYDDLFDKEPNVSFDLVAGADDDGDGAVTEAELRATDLRTLERYQVGSTGITDLFEFIRYQTRSVGHIDGEGHCETR